MNGRVGLRGYGRMGTALAAALRAAGLEVVPADDPSAGLVFLTVPDAAIAAVSAALGGGRLVHTSGTVPAAALAGGGPKAAFHPLMAVAAGSGAEVFRGATVSIECDDDALAEDLHALALAIGAQPVRVDAHRKAALHQAAVWVSNFRLALHAAADAHLAASGIDRRSADLFAALIAQTEANLTTAAPADILTGPASRGDWEVVRTQLARSTDPAARLAYLGLTRILAEAAGLTPPDDLRTPGI